MKTESTMKDVIAALLQAQIKKTFIPSAQANATEEEAAGIMLSQYFQWDGLSILEVAQAGLEDANFHKESAAIGEMIEKVKKEFAELDKKEAI